MSFTPRFYRAAAIASFVSALTTLLLIFMPLAYAPAEGFDGRMARVADPAYLVRAWAYLLHPIVAFTAALGVALRLRKVASGPALCGVLGFGVWATTEAAQQTLTLMAFDRWRAAWPGADAALRTQIQAQVAVYDGIWDAMFFLLLLAFLIANLAYALALARGRRLAKVLSWFYIGAAVLTLFVISGEFGGPTLPSPLDFWLYPALQPVARTLIGVWLWREADEREPLKDGPVSHAAA